MKKRSKKISQEIRPWVRVGSPIDYYAAPKPFAARAVDAAIFDEAFDSEEEVLENKIGVEETDEIQQSGGGPDEQVDDETKHEEERHVYSDEEDELAGTELDVPGRTKARWTEGLKKSRQAEVLNFQHVTSGQKSLKKLILQTKQLYPNVEILRTRIGHRFVPHSWRREDFYTQAAGGITSNNPDRIHVTPRIAISTKIPNYDVERERIAAYNGAFARAIKNRDDNFYEPDKYLRHTYTNQRTKIRYTQLLSSELTITNRMGGRGRQKNSCFMIGRSRTFSRLTAFARHSTRQTAAFGYFAGIYK